MKKVCLVGLVLVFAIILLAVPAMAYTIVTFDGVGISGTDPYGNPWKLYQDKLGYNSLVFGTPGLGDYTVPWNGPVAATDFHAIFPSGWEILATTMTPGGFTYETRFEVEGPTALWGRTISGSTIDFAETGAADALTIGRYYFFNIQFVNPDLNPETFSFTASYTAVPEPTTMLLLGAGLLGLWAFRRKFKK